jgi:hypothetical protein
MNIRQMSRRLFAALALAALALPAPAARAQVPTYTPPVNPYYPPYTPPWGVGRGATLSGAANLVDAQGNFQIQTEQARIAREQANQAKLDTQRKTFDQMNYEKSNTPTRAEGMRAQASATVQRILTEAPVPEILSGNTINTLSTFIRRMVDQGVTGPLIPLEPSMVSQLNVSPPQGALTNPGLGIVGDWDNAPWPLSLYDARKDIDPLVRAVIYQAKNRDLNPKTYDQARRKIKSYQDNLYKMLTPGKVDTAGYIEAGTFLNDLDRSLSQLRQPDAYKFFAGDFVAKGNNVLELAMFLTGQGLKVTKATPGRDQAYIAVHNATVSYVRAAQSTSSFMTQIGDPSTLGRFGQKN